MFEEWFSEPLAMIYPEVPDTFSLGPHKYIFWVWLTPWSTRKRIEYFYKVGGLHQTERLENTLMELGTRLGRKVTD